jgi:plasmid stabilization system protein ParE
MKVVFTEDALRDLDAIADWLVVHDCFGNARPL